MPPTLEVVCTDEGCPLDMAELHYTYELVDAVEPADFRCPYCGGATLRDLTYSYADRDDR